MTTIPPIGTTPAGVPPTSSASPPRASTENRGVSTAATAPVIAAGGIVVSQTYPAPATEPGTDGKEKQPDREQVERAIRDVKKVVDPVARNLQFSIDEDTGRSVVKIIDNATNEVIRQIPSEELLRIASALDKSDGKTNEGVFVKHKA